MALPLSFTNNQRNVNFCFRENLRLSSFYSFGTMRINENWDILSWKVRGCIRKELLVDLPKAVRGGIKDETDSSPNVFGLM